MPAGVAAIDPHGGTRRVRAWAHLAVLRPAQAQRDRLADAPGHPGCTARQRRRQRVPGFDGPLDDLVGALFAGAVQAKLRPQVEGRHAAGGVLGQHGAQQGPRGIQAVEEGDSGRRTRVLLARQRPARPRQVPLQQGQQLTYRIGVARRRLEVGGEGEAPEQLLLEVAGDGFVTGAGKACLQGQAARPEGGCRAAEAAARNSHRRPCRGPAEPRS
ncbi:hypothetical protein G4G28_13615 [Massilia sp. Dwa41.01b]|uniref:hypothetical protein n=1 Tax=Massilia sp. Dwa41.01b TaxID=2709302 RepID=UPI001600E1DA|nr:hypothetical protein [Massilia sp. Dwa41.01b]QNA89246.1 hypothetical protein G4G28_13615 [Massilia sp. Dwa41.01b]